MVFYFLSDVVTPPAVLYMGEDKHENEELLKWGFPEDVWYDITSNDISSVALFGRFHVDKMSSAHVYLRRPKSMAMEDMPEDLITDCVQLVKANSIVGCKTNNINVVYTEFLNLKKTQRMDVGQVGFHDDKKVFTVRVERKMNEVVNRLNRTKELRRPNLREEREERDREETVDKRRRAEEQRRLEREEVERQRKEEEQRNYSSMMQEDMMKTNEFSDDVDFRAVEDDFM